MKQQDPSEQGRHRQLPVDRLDVADAEQEQRLIAEARHALDQQVDNLDATTLSRLQKARQNALASAKARQPSVFSWRSLPIASALACCFALVLVWPTLQPSRFEDGRIENTALAFDAGLEDLILVSELDDATLELVEEIEFAYWLSLEMDGAGAEGAEGLGRNG